MHHTIDLDTLHHILKQYSEDVFNDCTQIICKLLNSLDESAVIQDLKTFKSIKVLLNLYEKLYISNSATEIKFPINLLMKNIKKVLHYGDEGYDLDSNIQHEMSSLLHCLFKISCVQNSSEAVEELAQLYSHCITCLYDGRAGKDFKQDCFIFKLRIVQTVYNLLRDSTCEINMAQFYENSRLNSLNECDVFTKLLLHGDDDVAIQTLMFLVPGYIDCFTNEVMEIIWKEISSSVNSSSINYSRVMLILCSFFDMCFDETAVKNEVFFTYLLEDANYWQLIQSVLVKKDPVLRKQGMYLFKKTVEALSNTNKSIACCKENITFYWDLNLKNKLYKTYSEIITVLEFLDEQQIHIIKPIFLMAGKLLGDIEDCIEVSKYWILVVLQKALIHDNATVVRWGLINLLSHSLSLLSNKSQHCQEDIVKGIVEMLVPTLNNPSLYYGDSSVAQKLSDFFRNIAMNNIGRVFFNLFIRQVCSLVWSPEPLFFVMNAFSKICEWESYSFWGEHEIFEIRAFVLKAFKTYNKVIAVGIQCELLKTVMQLTDVENVPLKSILLLISSFSVMETLTKTGTGWWRIREWLTSSYSNWEAEEVLDSYKKQELEFNEQSISMILVLLYKFFTPKKSNPVVNQFTEMLLLFKDIDRRPYCQKALYDQYLSIISHIYKTSTTRPVKGMLKAVLPLVEDVMLYIRWQLKQISDLQDLSTCQLYLNAFENITKGQKLLSAESEEINSIFADVLCDLETSLHSGSETSAVELYCRIKFLNLLLELHPCEVKQNFLTSYLLTEVNTPLEKKAAHHEKTKDIQTLWGRMNSEFIETKWKIMEYLLKIELITHGPDQLETKNSKSDKDLIELCVEGLNAGGYGVLCPVMSVLKIVLPAMDNFSQAAEIITSVWKLMMERRKTEEFKSFAKGFVEMLFQKAFILKGERAQEILTEYADKIFSNSSLALVNILMRHIQLIDLARSSESLFCHVIGKALIFGPVLRRDEKLTGRVCSLIDRSRNCPVWGRRYAKLSFSVPNIISPNRNPEKTMLVQDSGDYFCAEDFSDYYTSTEVRARAVERILTLDKDSQNDQAIAKNLIDTLIKLEGEVGGNRERYFCDSHVHRVKHRVMQALLLLEPILSGDLARIKLSDWLFQGLLQENPQPSVRFQKEWLLIRILVKNRNLEFMLNDYLLSEIKSRGLCSLMVVQFHFCQLVPTDPARDSQRISYLVPFLLHQHFEVRLHAQVFLCYYLNRIRNSDLRNNDWVALSEALNVVYRVMMKQGLKNFLKLEYDFLIRSFNPLEHYSLETIYLDLPSLVKVGPDEWISTKLLLYCGVDPSKISIPLKNSPQYSLKNRSRYNFNFTGSELEGKVTEQMLGNYQKKIIPRKHSTPAWDEGSAFQTIAQKKDGLVVVASLIDRVPNLGGLARTCEIFGVSEYVISSLRYTEDKQFTSLSVTAEKWVALKEVKAKDLMAYILEMKQSGYVVVGAEQTLHSQPLSHVKFPKKTLLLLGNEKEGIPPNLLPLLDTCVEIPQLGIIRSLNVHVTGALFIWEYAKQNNFSNVAVDK